ncbi:MAG: tRNA (adenosine(37)-N6)-dimethylallyltransferase MiaA [Rhabdochlamydiaceae bacterium]
MILKDSSSLLENSEEALLAKSSLHPVVLPKDRKKIIVIAGPTAVGKTHLSMQLCRALGGEVISADSVQVYNGMDIGTAKATPLERKEIKHHLIDIKTLNDSFNVMDFYMEAMQAIESILRQDKVPVIVGGTGFYLHALIYGPPSGPPSVQELRSLIENECALKGVDYLFEKLRNIDPTYANMISCHDKQKIIRGLEIIELTGQKVSTFSLINHNAHHIYDFRCWFLNKPRDALYPIIEERCEQMLNSGLLEEINALIPLGLKKNKSASQAIGYRQGLSYLEQESNSANYHLFLQSFKAASRQYAKRQYTWFKKEPLFRWLDVSLMPSSTVLETIIQDYEQTL